jgi:hypothetical protein
MLPAERQKKTVNPLLKDYRSSCRVEDKPLISHESTTPWPCELPVGINIGFLGTQDMHKSLKATAESFLLVELFGTKLLQGRM